MVRKFVLERVLNLPQLLQTEVQRARAELARRIDEIKMIPTDQDGERFYVAETKWDLLAGDPMILRSIAGARNAPKIPFRISILPSHRDKQRKRS